MTELTIRKTPCESCPYRRDCPSGVWHETEYLKLAEYDKETSEQPQAIFCCHTSGKGTVCRGWLEVHPDSLAVRLGIIFGTLPSDLFAKFKPCGVKLFESGTAACRAGLRSIKRPGKAAIEVMGKIMKKRAKKSRR